MNKLKLSILILMLSGSALHAQVAPLCGATLFPYTDSFSAASQLSSCWTTVPGPSGFSASTPALQSSGQAVTATQTGYSVEMFTGLPTAPASQSIQASVTWSGATYPALTLDQQPNGDAIAFIPSLNGIINMVANSGNYPGGWLCQGNSARSGDTFLFTKTGTLYTASDVTTGAVICSVNVALYQGAPGFQIDNRTGTSSIGAVTVTSINPVAVVPSNPVAGAPSIPVAAGTAYTLTLSNFAIAPGLPQNALMLALVNAPPTQANQSWVGTQFDLSIDGVTLKCTYGQTFTGQAFTMNCTVPANSSSTGATAGQ